MAQQKVELRKIRDFSEVLNDTFLYIKQNLKPLLTCFIGISGIFMLGSAVINGIYEAEAGNVFQKIFKGGNYDNNTPSFLSGTYLLVAILGWLNVVAMKTSLIAYVKVYEAKQGEAPELSEVWLVFTKYFAKVFFYSLPVVLLSILGLLFCIAPGVYFWVVLLPFEMVLVIEETFSGAWERCFAIIKENFWPSLGIYIVAYLIYLVSAFLIGAVMSGITGGIAFFTTRDFGTTLGLVTSILNIFSFVFFIVWYIAAVLNYFSLAEKYDGTGMMRRIDNIGNSTSSNVEEQY